MKIVLICLISLIVAACSSVFHQNPTNKERLNDFCLILYDSISFSLDSITSNITKASEYNNENEFFSFLSHNHEILVFDYLRRKEVKRISSKGLDVTSYTIRNLDSIIVLDYSKKAIFLINSLGDILQKYNIRSSISYPPFPVTKIAPIIFKRDKIIFTGNFSGEYIDETKNNRPVTGIYDMKTKEIVYAVSYPQIYRDYNYGSGLFRWVYATYNDSLNTMVYSFPADHNLVTASNNFAETQVYYAGSKYIDGIYSLSQKKFMPLGSEEKIRHFAENHSYANILYDKFRNVYYRIVEIKTKYEGMPGWSKDISVIILDNNFKIIGETLIGSINSVNRYTIFVNEKGLHLLQNSDEDFMTFLIYRLQKDNEN